MVSRCACSPFEILKWQRMTGTQGFLCSQAPRWRKLSCTRVSRHQCSGEGEMLHSHLCPPFPSPIREIIPVCKEKLKKDFAAVQGACRSTLGTLGLTSWGEQPRRSHSSLGQALPSRTDQLCVLRMLLSSFALLHSSHSSMDHPIPILCLAQGSGTTVLEWCNSSAQWCRRAPKAFE